MLLVNFLLIIAGVYVTIHLFRLSEYFTHLSVGLLAVASIIFIGIQGIITLNAYANSSVGTFLADHVLEWGHVVILTLIFCSLALTIRSSKPAFAQFPKFYVVLPALIIVSYLLVRDTFAVKEWLFTIYQGGAIIIGLLLYGIYTFRNRDYLSVLVGVILMLLSYMFYWHVPFATDSLSILWEIMLVAGMLFMVSGFRQVANTGKVHQ